MSLKTEYGYNEDDFIEQGGELKELTVTITLCEYRNLVKETTYQDVIIEKLQEENKKLTHANNNLANFIANDKQNEIKDVFNLICRVLDVEVEQPNTEQHETEETTE